MSCHRLCVCAEYTRNTVQSKIPYFPTLTLGVSDGYMKKVQFGDNLLRLYLSSDI